MVGEARPKLRLKVEYEEPVRRTYVETCVVCGRVETSSGWSDDPPLQFGPHVCHVCDARRGRRPAWPWTGGVDWRDASRLLTLDLLTWHLEHAA